jgi:hypothetical protein
MTTPFIERKILRTLCPEADERDAENDDVFWDRVNRNLDFGADVVDVADDCDQDDLDDLQGSPQPCPVCGSYGACAVDAEGQPLIHATAEDT